MTSAHIVVVVTLCGLAAASAACTRDEVDQAVDQAVEKTREGAIAVEQGAKAAGEKVASGATVDTTKEVAGKVADKTVEVAAVAAEKARELAETAAEVISDAWITAKLKAKFADDVSLDGAAINVDTKDFVVTLKGTVPSAAAKAKAQTIATDTRGVKTVVNQLVVK
jgi:osmotically-inducible protein OsmY